MSADFGEKSVKKHRHRFALHARDQTDCSSTLMHASADPVRLSLAECILLYRFINAEKKAKILSERQEFRCPANVLVR